MIRYFSAVVLPTLGTLYFILALIWGLPNAKEVLGSVVVIQTAVNVVLGIRKNGNGYSGTIVATKTKTKTVYSLEFDDDPAALADRNEVTFKVERRDQPE